MKQNLMGLLCVSILFSIAWSSHAQDDNLALISQAYEQTAAVGNYRVSASQSINETLIMRRLLSKTFLMDVDIFESAIITSKQEQEIDGVVAGDEIQATIKAEARQEQTLGEEFILRGEPLTQLRGVSNDADLEAQLTWATSGFYLNMDETDSELRSGVPSGWILVTDETPILTDALISLTDLQAALTNLRFKDVRLLFGAVTTIEVLDTGALGGQVMQRYLLTFDMDSVLAAGGFSITTLNLSEEMITALLADSLYTIEVWIGEDDGYVHKQILTFSFGGELEPNQFEGMPAETRVIYRYSQTFEMALSEIGGDLRVLPPPHAEILG